MQFFNRVIYKGERPQSFLSKSTNNIKQKANLVKEIIKGLIILLSLSISYIGGLIEGLIVGISLNKLDNQQFQSVFLLLILTVIVLE